MTQNGKVGKRSWGTCRWSHTLWAGARFAFGICQGCCVTQKEPNFQRENTEYLLAFLKI